jgi:formylglycine-generating enzyme required for sulfatase activity
MAWYIENSGGFMSGYKTHPVKKKTPNAWGLYDMHGNVEELCADWFGNYTAEVKNDPTGPQTGTGRVVRGGNFIVTEGSASRMEYGPERRVNTLGFRIAVQATP